MRVFCTLLLLSTPGLIAHPDLRAQPISGVINTYARILSFDACTNALTVSSTSGFAVGDTVLLLVMQGAPIDTVDSSFYGAPGTTRAGNAELARIAAIPDGIHLVFANVIRGAYTGNASGGIGGTLVAQAIRIPHYRSAHVTGTLTASAWNPVTQTGGVLALSADTLTLASDIDVSGLGFHGGLASSNGGVGEYEHYHCAGASANGGYKGEGVAGTMPSGFEAGRGAVATGGGGGNSHNAGGGGGSNWGLGGLGGNETNEAPFTGATNGGRGGWSFANGEMVLGGGGGGGHENDGGGSAGGNGGGIILIFAKALIGNSHRIAANGDSAVPSTLDGAGGGGAGGSIVLDVDSISGNLFVSANGGGGGVADAQGTPYGYGPGGGGGGGWISSRATLPNSAGAVQAYGGPPGRVRNSSSVSINDSNYGATAGAAGAEAPVAVGYLTYVSEPFTLPGAVLHELSTCSGTPVTISAGGGWAYRWSPSVGMSDPTQATERVTPTATTVYTVQITSDSCVYTDTVRVDVLPAPVAVFTGPTTSCSGDTATYSIPPQDDRSSAGISYRWAVVGGAPAPVLDTAAADSIRIAWISGGLETISLIASNGSCSDSSSLVVPVASPISPRITATKLVLSGAGDTSLLSVSGSYVAYRWSTGDTTRTLTVDSAGTYSVAVLDSNGCMGSDSVRIANLSSLPWIELGLPDISAKPGDHVLLPITIIASRNLSAADLSSFSYTLHFDASLLEPLEAGTTSTYQHGDRFVTSRGTITNQLSTHTLDQMEFLAALGDATETTLSFDTVIWSSGQPIATKLDTGHFTLLGVCPAGGNRLFFGDDSVAITDVTPNPVSSMAVVNYSLAEPGATTLHVLDMLGRTVLTIVNGDASAGTYHALFDASALPNGMYNLVLQTPSQIFLKRLEVYH